MNNVICLTKEHKSKIAKSMRGNKNRQGSTHTKETKDNISYSCSKTWVKRKQYRLTHFGLDRKKYESLDNNALREAQIEWEEKHKDNTIDDLPF
jgi:hypothetical protein